MNLLRNKGARFIFSAFLVLSVIFIIMGFSIDKSTGIFAAVICAAFSCTTYISEKTRYYKLAELSEKIDMILHSDRLVSLDEIEEGEFAILESEIRKMTVRIREGAYLLQKEKIYLTDSIADISHQLRTPLTTINLILSSLQKAELSDRDRMRYVAEITSHLRRIDWLISSLLKISKLDAGTVVMKKEKVKVSTVIGKAAESVMIPMEIRNQLFDYLSKGGESFEGDVNWTVEAVSNIIKNCMEHTPDGGHVMVRAKENILYTKIIIEDTGSGVSKEDLPHIFERFYRGKNSSDSSVGIGLALARMIIQNQNGTIKVENKKSGGTRFIIKFYKGGENGSIKS